ncbi:MAG TPA: ATP-binding protein, partial [Pyrinomonadaceae bacterium]|nr:ATP-binding protein [Pyrinomonadaceae bacterium]
NDKAQIAAGSLLNEVRNLSGMVTAFLNFARPQPLLLEQVVVSELINECASELEPVFQELRVELVVDTSEPLVVRADERMLRLALLNLMRNGAEAIPDETAERKVIVRTGPATIEVRDTGSGIPLAQLQKIFIPFFTTKAKGHGVGLALTHRIITEHGGTLTAGNSPGGGAVFTIRFSHQNAQEEHKNN